MEIEISSGDKIGFSIPNLFRRCKLGEDDVVVIDIIKVSLEGKYNVLIV